MSSLRPALVTFIGLALLSGLAYPLFITGVGRVFLREKAAGSLIVLDGRVLGSELIGQHTEDPHYFWGRLSATGGFPTNAAASGGSNLAPSNPELGRAAERRIRALRVADQDHAEPVPVELVTASGSGLDPHISPAAAAFQAPRIARVRGLPLGQVQELVRRHTQGRTLGFIGEPRVNVLALNLALDGLR